LAAWGPCNATCGQGFMSKIYTITRPALQGGLACPAAHVLSRRAHAQDQQTLESTPQTAPSVSLATLALHAPSALLGNGQQEALQLQLRARHVAMAAPRQAQGQTPVLAAVSCQDRCPGSLHSTLNASCTAPFQILAVLPISYPVTMPLRVVPTRCCHRGQGRQHIRRTSAHQDVHVA
jgi:hypothetical protein